jgi:hypothetical protein
MESLSLSCGGCILSFCFGAFHFSACIVNALIWSTFSCLYHCYYPVLIACFHDVYLPFTLVGVFSALIWSILDVES